MAMAMSVSTVSALTYSSAIPSHSAAPEACTSSKCIPSSTLSRTRRWRAQSSRDCGEGADGSGEGLSSRWRRRECFLAMALVGAVASQESALAEVTEVVVDAPTLELYVDEKEGFKLLRPALWNKVQEPEMDAITVIFQVEKAGATVLFEDPAKRGNTIGVVVNPVRIASLKDFGTPDVVAEKLLAAERKKPSTNDAQLLRVQERLANGDTPLYSLEYTLDSSRGQKKILSAVTVASKKLYILNITYVDSAATPAPPAMAQAYEQVLKSFDLVVRAIPVAL